jgi:hypothetical protein
MARNAITAADPTATRTGTTHPGRRLTVAPVKSRRRSSHHEPARQATIHSTLTVEQLDLAGVGGEQAEQEPQQRGLAGPVGAEQTSNLTGPNHQVDAVHGTRRLEALDEPARTYCRHPRHYTVAGILTLFVG